ncbi:MAG: dihydroorotase [Legionellaceae bacterium]|nr:dihydroorotase [Legionellaceae bacterium]
MLNISIVRPDDWHVHFRDDEILKDTVRASAKHFHRALIMPNLDPPLTNISSVLDYRSRIMRKLTNDGKFKPYMTLYLNKTLLPEEIYNIKSEPSILGTKLYPKGATTNSAHGVNSIKDLYPHFEALQDADLVLQIHGEVTHSDIFDREKLFIEEYLQPIVTNFPKLRIVLEHISTKEAVDYILESPSNISATITPHHLLFNRNELLAGGIKPHYYCLPILKRDTDQKSLLQAATSGNKKFFAGTDSAPHTKSQKESSCGCAGVYSAPFALAMYAEAFSDLDSLDKLENFMSKFGAEFYQLPISSEEIELKRKPQTIPQTLPLGHDIVVPLAAGRTLQWSIS